MIVILELYSNHCNLREQQLVGKLFWKDWETQVKLEKTRKLWYLSLWKFRPLLLKINFWERDWTLAFVSIQFWDFLIMSINPQILIPRFFSNSWGNSYTKFIVIDIKFGFACSESNLHENNVNCQNILSPIVWKLSFAFYHFNKDSNFCK